MKKIKRSIHKEVWLSLSQQVDKIKDLKIKDLFASNPNRFEEFSLSQGNFLLDYSKQSVTAETLDLLLALANSANLRQKIDALFSGEKINYSENRSVLHTALRDFSTNNLLIDGQDIKAQINDVLFKMEDFVVQFHQGQYKSATGLPFTDIICLGIGGSELGPSLVTQALSEYNAHQLKLHFISNCFGPTLNRILKTLNPETTLCIISSKTFTTPETLVNANSIFSWYQQAFKKAFQHKFQQEEIQKHFLAITASRTKAERWGILPDNVFEFWEGVGGRFSIWSAVGLPVALTIGMDHFKSFLRGARSMDTHFYTADFAQNMPVMMALLGLWNCNFLGASTQAILAYDDRLEKLPDYLQQLEMESNGKSLSCTQESLEYNTVPVIWGGIGCNGQHAYMQMLHQGTQFIPVDFLLPAKGDPSYSEQHKLLFASCLSQSKALMEGQEDVNQKEKYCPGNRPSTTLVYSELSPHTLGALIALYEHKVFVQGVLWEINSFDQWGVELGKALAKKIQPALEKNYNGNLEEEFDGSSRGLIEYFKRLHS